MKSAFAYVPRPGPLQAASPGAAVAYLGSLLVVAFLFRSPLLLAAVIAALALAGRIAGAGRAVRLGLRLGFGTALLVAWVNALLVDRGETVLARLGHWPLLGQVDVTLEAAAEGLVLGLLVFATMLAAAVYSSCVDPDRVLRALRPLAGRSALTATLVSRLVPVAAADGVRLRDAARLRGAAAAPIGRAPLARRLLAGSLDRAVDVAATLELRGYGLGAPRLRGGGRRSRYDGRFYAVAAVLVVAAVAAKVAGVGDFHAYPTISVDLGAGTVALAALVLLAGLAPLRLRRAPRAALAPPVAALRGPAAAPPLGAGRV
jgi:energy-coupling factor transport system permease protein